MRGSSWRIAIYLGIAVALLGGLALAHFETISNGAGIFLATLAAGAGWLIREDVAQRRTVRNICQAYAATIEIQFEEFWDCLSDGELDRFLSLAPAIAAGKAAEAPANRVADPATRLPDLRDHHHLLSFQTVRWLTKWRIRNDDLQDILDKLGTREQCGVGTMRLALHHAAVRQYRDGYRDIGYTCLTYLAKDMPDLAVNLAAFTARGARFLTE